MVSIGHLTFPDCKNYHESAFKSKHSSIGCSKRSARLLPITQYKTAIVALQSYDTPFMAMNTIKYLMACTHKVLMKWNNAFESL